MAHSLRPSRIPFKFSQPVLQRINAYALAAGAAGVGMLALAQPAEGRIVYTASHVQLMNQNQVFLDFNHDGINDFSFYGHSTSRRSISTFDFRLTASPAVQGNAIWGIESRGHTSCAARLPANRRIGPKRRFQPNRVVLLDQSGGPDGGSAYCPWAGKAGAAYLGLKFSINGKVHFGWARIKVNLFDQKGVVVTGYAYETIPNKPIIAGQTKGSDDSQVEVPSASRSMHTLGSASLGLLAQGASELSIWRRETPARGNSQAE